MYQIGYRPEARPPFEFVPVEPDRPGLCPEEYRGLIAIDTVHDGHVIPRQLLDSPRARPLLEDGTLRRAFVLERDWGADLVAGHLARALGLPGYHRVTTARVVMDFNRFPGSSPPEAPPLERLAIINPFARALDRHEKRFILRSFYDSVSEGMEAAILGKLFKLAVHSYDAFNPTRTERPEVSLITRALSYQLHSRLPFGLFDPLFPDVLAESTCNSVLRDRLAITLEKAGISVEHNYPYCAPDGSLEVRTQPWFYFQRVRALFEERAPETRRDPAYERVWDMLLNTNLRDGDGDALRSYLHRFRSPTAGRAADFEASAEAYERLGEFLRSSPLMLEEYRRSPARPSSLSLEVRKDLIFRFEGEEPLAPIEENAAAIARKAAEGVAAYLRQDLGDLLGRGGAGLARWPTAGGRGGETGL